MKTDEELVNGETNRASEQLPRRTKENAQSDELQASHL